MAKVKLIQMTQNPIDVMWVSARTCYSEKSPIEMWNYDRYNQTQEEIDECFELKEEWVQERQEKMWKLVKKVLDSGHCSIAEHCYFTFVIEGVSRALLAQITRHRAGIVFSVMSQRYVEIKEKYEDIRDLVVSIDPMCEYFDEINCDKDEKKLIKILEKYFVDVNEDTVIGYGQALMHYLRAIDNDEKPEDARRYLPNATKTNITMSVNYRELMHLFNLRSCSRAQREIRDLFKLIKKEVERVEPRLAEYLVPSCEAVGFCKEHNCCGRKPKLKDILEKAQKYDDLKH